MDFSLRLKELREKRKISQKQLAMNLGVGVGTVGMWESSNRTPPAKKLKLIADYFDVTIDYLLGYDIISDEEYAEGARATVRKNLTPIEDEMLYAFRQVGKKLGEKGQLTLIEVAEGMAGIK